MKGFTAFFLLATATVAKAESTITIAFGDTTLPYTLPDSKDALHRGMSVDAIREALANAGYKLEPKFVPYARRLLVYKSGVGSQRVDAAVDVIGAYVKEYGLKGFLSVPTLPYNNVAVSLRSKGLSIKSVPDLAKHSILAFQGAATVLGPEYGAMAAKNPKHEETADQCSQVKRLYLKRVDVAVMAEEIFTYCKKLVETATGKAINTKQPIDVSRIFAPISYSVLFKDNKIRAAFDREYAKLESGGRLAEIIGYYLK